MAKFEVIFDGSMTTIIANPDGQGFRECKKEAIEYLDSMIKDLKEVKREIRSMKAKEVES